MNTNDLYLEYARVIQMCNGTELEDTPWECVKYFNGGVVKFSKPPDFSALDHGHREWCFAVAVLEGKPVFVGDTIYYKCDGEKLEIVRAGRDGDIIIKELFNREVSIEFFPDDFTWNRTPPTPKRTFTLNGVELPCPDPGLDPSVNGFSMGIEINGYGESFAYASHDDAEKVFKYLKNLLTEARDKP